VLNPHCDAKKQGFVVNCLVFASEIGYRGTKRELERLNEELTAFIPAEVAASSALLASAK
jgi:hypothetical protein